MGILHALNGINHFALYSKRVTSRLEPRLWHVALATSKYASCGVFLRVQHACHVPIVLHHYLQSLQKYYVLFCVFDPHAVTPCDVLST